MANTLQPGATSETAKRPTGNNRAVSPLRHRNHNVRNTLLATLIIIASSIVLYPRQLATLGAGKVGSGGGGGLPWSVGWNDTGVSLGSACPADGFGGSTQSNGTAAPYSNTWCAANMNAWSGGVARTKTGSEELCWFGGGHSDSGDNSIYCLDIHASPATVNRISGPDQVLAADYGTCNESPPSNPNAPAARHSQDNLTYVANLDELLTVNGAVYCGNGLHLEGVWAFHFSDNTWHHLTNTPFTGDNYWDNVCYDPTSHLVYVDAPVSGTGYLFTYNPGTDTWSSLLSQLNGGMPDTGTCTVDTTHNKMYVIGNTAFNSAGSLSIIQVDLSTYTQTDLTGTSSGCSALSTSGPGIAYDANMDRIIGWPVNNGQTLVIYNPNTNSCTTTTPSGATPGNNASSNGVYGRFGYFPSFGKDVFALANGTSLNGFVVRLTP